MKGFGSSILLCALVHVAFVFGKVPDWIPPDMLDMVKGDKTRCMNEHGTTQAMIDAASEGKFDNDPKITCYMFCLFEAFSLADDEGNVDIDLLTSILPEHLQKDALDAFGSCGEEGGGDPCEKFYNMGRCAIARRPDMWFMI